MNDVLETERHDSPNKVANDSQHQYVTFMVDGRSYGVDIRLVREIKQWSPTTTLPNQPTHTRGVLNLRGTIVPVHDLRVRFGGAQTDADETNVIVIVLIGAKTVGILVDGVSDIISISSNDIGAVPSGGQGETEASISGLVNLEGGMVALLDLNTLFPSPENDTNAA